MQVLTPSGYVDALSLSPGDAVQTFDTYTGLPLTNYVEKVEIERYGEATHEEEVFVGAEPVMVLVPEPFYWVLVNGSLRLFRNQSIWRNGTNVCHAYQLQVGDEIYDENDAAVAVESVEEDLDDHGEFIRFSISGDHSFTADGLILHNASRYWNKQNATATWAITGPTNWGSATNTADGASVPTSSDDVFFDGVGGGANNSTCGGSISIKSLDCTGFANTLTINAVTLTCAPGASSVAFKLVSGMTFTPNSNSVVSFTGTGTTTITSNGKSFAGLTMNGSGGTFTFADALNTSDVCTLTAGTMNYSAAAPTCKRFSSSNSNTRTITSGGNHMSLTATSAGAGTAVAGATLTNLTITTDFWVDLTSSSVYEWGTTAGTEAQAANLKYTAGGGSPTPSWNGLIGSLDLSACSATINPGGQTIYGNVALGSGDTGMVLTFAGTGSVQTITSSGNTGIISIGGSVGSAGVKLIDAFSQSVALAHSAGQIDLNGFTLTALTYTMSGTATLTSGVSGGKLRTTTTLTTTAFSYSAGTLSNLSNWSIEISGNTSNTRTFAGGGATYGALIFSSTTASSALTLTGSNTFASISYTGGVAASIKPTAGTNTTFTTDGFPSGTSGNLLTWTSVTASGHTVTKSGGGTVSADYLSLSRSTASPASTFYAGTHSTNGGSNTNWTFTAPPSGSSANFFALF